MTGSSGIVIGYYFGSKANNKVTEEMIKSHKEVVETQKFLMDKEVETRNTLLDRKDREIETITRNINRGILMEDIV